MNINHKYIFYFSLFFFFTSICEYSLFNIEILYTKCFYIYTKLQKHTQKQETEVNKAELYASDTKQSLHTQTQI